MNNLHNPIARRIASVFLLGTLVTSQVVAPLIGVATQEQTANAATVNTAGIRAKMQAHSKYYFQELPKSNWVLQANKAEVQAAADLIYHQQIWLASMEQLRAPLGKFSEADKQAFISQGMSDFEKYFPSRLRAIRA